MRVFSMPHLPIGAQLRHDRLHGVKRKLLRKSARRTNDSRGAMRFDCYRPARYAEEEDKRGD